MVPALGFLVAAGLVPLVGEFPAGAEAQEPVRIMALGDSLTRGVGDGNTSPGGYRVELEDLLAASGRAFDLVGTLVDGPVTLADRAHDGHGGYRIDEVLTGRAGDGGGVAGWLEAARPDVILLQIGTNDLAKNYEPATAPDRLSELVGRITAEAPTAHLFVASLTPMRDWFDPALPQRGRDYNTDIPGVVQVWQGQGRRVSFVDMHSMLDPTRDLRDELHPNAKGYSKMATAWYQTLMGTVLEPPPSTHLSLLSPKSHTNNVGPYERDMSNGGVERGDGRVITLNGVTYTKGIGVTAASELVYYLGGGYDTFAADVGVDDAVGLNGSVVFQVFVDGVKAWDSGGMEGPSATKRANVSVAGKSELRLVVTNAGDGSTGDHADWADARLLAGPAGDTTPPAVTARSPAADATGVAPGTTVSATFGEDVQPASVTFTLERAAGDGVAAAVTYDGAARRAVLTPSAVLAAGETYRASVSASDLAGNAMVGPAVWSFTVASVTGTVHLSDMTPTSATNGAGPYERDTSNGGSAAGDGRTITLNGRAYAKGLGVNSTSTLVYDLGGLYQTFAADVGVDDEVGSAGTVVFKVLVDGLLVYSSGVMTGSSATKTLSITVSGKHELRLVVNHAGDGTTKDHADWADARLSRP
jgi:lysophospholipase L1-like esterase